MRTLAWRDMDRACDINRWICAQGIDEAVQLMHVGDVYDLTLPPSLAFGKKGRRASAGKPSIPPDAQIDFTLELSSIPGKEDELLEVVGFADE